MSNALTPEEKEQLDADTAAFFQFFFDYPLLQEEIDQFEQAFEPPTEAE
ncbi:hypothetical protein HFO91_30490 [Rhizobium leguminosarum]|nr:hypothetical protein [Rhizobium leguminosarum]MBY5453909.1 hypothetical protein [Rhizobium leguminosarum]